MKNLIPLTMILMSQTALASFNSRFYQQMAKGETGNINFSPLSMKMALNLVYLGASGDTQKYFEKELEFPMKSSNPEKLEQIQIANSVWFKDEKEIEGSYLKAVKALGAATGNVDLKAINDWVANATQGKINRLLEKADPKTFAIFVNAIYFKAQWNLPFDKANTEEQNFTISKKQNEKVQMMNLTKHFNYYEDQDSQWVRLAYRDSPFVMLLGLPKKKDGLKTIEKNFSEETLKVVEGKMGSAKVRLSIPKFKFDQKGSLKETLIKMGLGDLFKTSDYTLLSKNPALSISDIIQATNITVDEEGTEAAAATAVRMMEGSAMGFGDTLKVFHADHPFLFALKDEKTGEIYFMGRVVKP